MCSTLFYVKQAKLLIRNLHVMYYIFHGETLNVIRDAYKPKSKTGMR